VGGVGQPITLSLTAQVEVELGCDKIPFIDLINFMNETGLPSDQKNLYFPCHIPGSDFHGFLNFKMLTSF
jgi:hypothetical protein